MLSGFHHVALVTEDLDRLIAFYAEVFDAKVRVDLSERKVRHALIDIGGGAALHPFEMPGNAAARGSEEMFGRGHLDHLALNVADEETFQELRRRLIEAGACDGMTTDFGVVKTCFFTDPDGMECEIAIWKEGNPLSRDDAIREPYPG